MIRTLGIPTQDAALLFGGTFDPPHLGHIGVAKAARDSVDPSMWLVLVPAARSPFKADQPTAPDADRVAMLQAATAGIDRVTIWLDEIERANGDPTFWIDTLKRLDEVHSGPLRFLLGSDQAVAFHHWKAADQILQRATPLVVLRAPHATLEEFRSDAWDATARDRWHSWTLTGLDDRFAHLSSTGVRAMLSANDRAGLQHALHPDVLRIIDQRFLYKTAH